MQKLEIAKEAAKIGAATASSYFGKNLHIDRKNDSTPVTLADKKTEEAIKKYILSQDPEAKFVGEESGGDYEEEEYWLIDPIDGTAFFARDIPIWGTLVTYVKNKEAIIGVSYVPFVDELLWAEKGKGAFLNGKKIHVSNRSRIEDAFITYTSFYRIVDKFPGFKDMALRSYKTKVVGDSYSWHLLASGRVEAKYDGAPLPFDVAGLNLIIEEAGGKVTNFDGQPWTFSDRTVVASNGLIHNTLFELGRAQEGIEITSNESHEIRNIVRSINYEILAKDLSTQQLADVLMDTIIHLKINKPEIITLTAGPASGKSHMMQALINDLTEKNHKADYLITDDYNITDRIGRDARIRKGVSPYDEKDFQQLNKDIELIRSNEVVIIPQYDPFTGEGVNSSKEKRTISRDLDFFFVEGDFQPLTNPDFAIYMHVDSSTRKSNRIIRDMLERNGKSEDEVAKSFDERQKQFFTFTLPFAKKADLFIMTKVKRNKPGSEMNFIYTFDLYKKSHE